MPTFIEATDLVLRLLLAAGLGAAIGLEREMRSKPAGLRTNILVSIGAAIFTIVSITISDGTSDDRIAAQVVTGIGFLGAGAILRRGDGVHGMTTAATIWVNASIGMAAGAGRFTIAVTGTLITLFVLLLLARLESRLERRRQDS